MLRVAAVMALLLWCLPLQAQEIYFFHQKCYGSGAVLVTGSPGTAGTIEVAVRNIIPPDNTSLDDPLAGKLVFRTVASAVTAPVARVGVTVVMHDAHSYKMENPYTVIFSGPASAHFVHNRRVIKGTLVAEISDRRDPTDDLGPSIMQFDTIKLTFIPEMSPLPYQLEWQGIVWKGDLIVFERWGR